MDNQSSFFKAAAKVVNANYALLSQENVHSSENQITDLLNHRAMPKQPFDPLTVEMLMNRIALMDSNNFSNQCGVGEREARIFSTTVR